MLTKPNCVCEVDKISKKFSHNMKSALKYGANDMFKAALGIATNQSALRPGEFWAVKDVSFDLKPGEGLGLVGLNGSGKSTILKMLNGIYLPNEGEIRLNGKMGALIEIASGFHPNLTGKQNIYHKGALMGLKKEMIDELFDSIVDFADIGKFIDSPVKMYSSGMHVRLGFSVAVNISPDILLVDEVLAVGDFRFRQKCLDKINELRSKMSVILVSHNMNDIILFCNKAIVIDKGKVGFDGTPKDAAKFYFEEVEAKAKKKIIHKKEMKQKKAVRASFAGQVFHNSEKINNVNCHWADADDNQITAVKTSQHLALKFSFNLLYKPKNLIIGVPIWTKDGDYVTAVSTDIYDQKIDIKNDNYIEGKLIFDRNIFNPADYISVLSIFDRNECIYRELNEGFKIIPSHRHFGFVTAEHRWEFY